MTSRSEADYAPVLNPLPLFIDQRIERLDAEPAQNGLVLAVRLGGVDHVIALVEPVADQRFLWERGTCASSCANQVANDSARHVAQPC